MMKNFIPAIKYVVEKQSFLGTLKILVLWAKSNDL